MATHTVAGFIVATRHSFEKTPTYGFQMYKPSAQYSPETVVIREHQITVEVDDGHDITAGLVANLEEKKRELRVKLAKQLMLIDDEIGKLTCIDYVPKAPVEEEDYPF